MAPETTYEYTVSPRSAKHVSPDHLPWYATCILRNLEKIPAPIKTDGAYIRWAVQRKWKILAIPCSGVKAYPSCRQGRDEL